MKASKIRKLSSLPRGLEKNGLLIYDRKLERLPFAKEWIGRFPRKLAVTAGEPLKDLHLFPAAMEKILKLSADVSPARLKIVALGGGSVGDFAGFVASVLKRGVGLVQIPSTWLAAIDSAHGGKTALNLPPYKNQIGTFYPAEAIYLVGDLLKSQPEKLAKQALAELAKIALIDSAAFWKKLTGGKTKAATELLWKNIKPAVDAKWKVVMRDPYEKKGIRQVLNLGHTFGHFLEGHFGLSHGDSVAQGLFFALEWSCREKIISLKDYQAVNGGFRKIGLRPMPPQKVSRKELQKAIAQDKKSKGGGKVNFVFLQAPGKTLIQAVSIERMADQAAALGWLR